MSSLAGIVNQCFSEIVLHVEPGILDVAKVFAFFQTHAGAVISETLLEPEIIPPFHGHEITEPHVRELMHCNFGPHLSFKIGHLARCCEECISHDNETNIFHAADAKLRDKDLIVLLEREGTTEKLFEKGD